MDGPLWQEFSELRRQELLEEAEHQRLVRRASGQRPRRALGPQRLVVRLLAVLVRRRPVSQQAPVVALPGAGSRPGTHRRVPPGSRRCGSREA